MRKNVLILLCLLAALIVPYMQIIASAAAVPDWQQWSSSKKSILVELFTSQGCSSCPPADRLLSEIAANAQNTKAPVYVLSFHVDYWNYLGWDDPYSETWATKRQYKYKQVFGTSSAYTPQAVVNGQKQFVGSSANKMYQAIASLVAQKDEVLLKQSLVNPGDLKREFRVSYLADKARSLSNMRLMLAYVDSQRNNSVDSGENAGSTLSHTNVVTELSSYPLQVEVGARPQTVRTKIKLKRPPTADKPVLVFVQDPKTMQVHTAMLIVS